MGVYEHKVAKCKGKSKIIWGNLKGKVSVGIVDRNEETGITVIARPVGVVGAITPCTNPVVTPMCNAMFAIKGRNTVIISPHPRAKKLTAQLVAMFNEAIKPLGAPENVIQYIDPPSVEASSELMKQVDVVVATGGMAMVKSAYSSGKPAYGVGAGNVQCIIDRGMASPLRFLRSSKAEPLTNGIICPASRRSSRRRKEYDAIMAEAAKNGAVCVTDPAQLAERRDTIFPGGVMNKDLVGVSAGQVAGSRGYQRTRRHPCHPHRGRRLRQGRHPLQREDVPGNLHLSLRYF